MLGGSFVGKVRYAPEAKEFSAEAKALSDAVKSAIDLYGVDKVGVYYIAFEEAATFLSTAREYDVLSRVKWYGSDGTVQSEALLKDLKVAEFCSKTNFTNPIFAATKSEKFNAVLDRVKSVLGRVPDTYAYAAYDIVQAIAYSLIV
jgi:branched-chain amino acid transport system substrate-binding protein